MSIKPELIRASLKKHMGWLQPDVHDGIVRGLQADRLVDADGVVHASVTRFPPADDGDAASLSAAANGLQKLSPIQARSLAQGNANLLRAFNRVAAQARRFGLKLGDGPLDMVDIDAALKSADVSIPTRFEFKCALRALHMV